MNATPLQKVKIFNAATGVVEEVEPVRKTDAEWQRLLTPEQFRITRLKETEAPFTGRCTIPPPGVTGILQCVCCGTDLFKIDKKFESGTGWPSFWQPVSELNVRLVPDKSLGMRRIEVLCTRCGAHLGHVFDDGPPPTGLRYCINAAALRLLASGGGRITEKATFAAGCFWGVESAFRTLVGRGVTATRVGYTGGHTPNPTYKEVCTDRTGHAEAVEVEYDPKIIRYSQLLDLFWSIHDPTTPDRQGPDVGTQYRSAIFYHTPEQERLARESLMHRQQAQTDGRTLVTQISPAREFYPAEEYHQQYFEKQGIAPTCHVRP